MPEVISPRGPKRLIKPPQKGEMKTIGAVTGRIRMPAPTGP
jgi:hypothetical protein